MPRPDATRTRRSFERRSCTSWIRFNACVTALTAHVMSQITSAVASAMSGVLSVAKIC